MQHPRGGFNADSTVYKSFDRGESWMTAGEKFEHGVAALAIAPSDSRIIYAGSVRGDAYIYRSSDSGVSWEEMRVIDGSGGQHWNLNCLGVDAVDPNTVYGYMESEARGWGVYRSTDGGRHWEAIKADLGENRPELQFVSVHPTVGGIVYLGGGSSGTEGVSRSTDGGREWTMIGPELAGVRAIAFDHGNPNIMYAGSEGTIYRTMDGGASWIPLGFLDARIIWITPNPRGNGVIYVGTNRGVYISSRK